MSDVRRGKPAPPCAALRERMPQQAAMVSAGAALAAAVVAAEVLHWRASRAELGDAPRNDGTEAVVVLGYRDRARGGRANWINRWRVRAGIRSLDPTARESLLVLCGGAVGGWVPEAELMAAYARELGYAGPIALDTRSTTTWQNIENAAALIEDAGAIKIVSNALHAAKGRRYLVAQRPDLAARLVRADDHRLGEQWWLGPFAVYRDLRHTLGSWRRG